MPDRWLLPAVALAVVGGCEDTESTDTTSIAQDDATPAAASRATATRQSRAVSPAGSALPGAGSTIRYVGNWASRADLCGDAAWHFTQDGLAIEDGPICNFTKVTEVAGGYEIDAVCDQRGHHAAETVALRFAESARAMIVSGMTSLPDTGLVYCGSA